MIPFKRVVFTILLGITLLPAGLSQPDSTQEIRADSVAEVPKHTGYVAGGFGNNLVYLGSTISGNQPFFYSSLVYGFQGELFASFSAFHLSNTSPAFPFFNESLVYSHVINSWFDYSFTFSGYQTNKAWADTVFSDFYYGDMTLGVDWKLIYSKLSFGGVLSDENNIYFQICNSRYFETSEFAKGKLSISFDPYANAVWGRYNPKETTLKSGVASRTYGSNGGSSSAGSKFGLLEIDFGLPVALNSKRVTLETEAGYIIPIKSDPLIQGFSFFISAYFKIF